MQNGYSYIGKPRKIVDGLEKVTGYVKYVADLKVGGMQYGRLVLSPYAHARIVSVDKTEALAMPGVVAVLTAEDLPTRDRTIRSRNTAVLAKERVLWVGQPVAVIVAESERQATDAADMLFIEYEPLPAVIDLEQAIDHDAPTLWPHGLPEDGDDMSGLHGGGGDDNVEETEIPRYNNVSEAAHYQRGDVEAALATADVVVEGEFRTAMVHQLYLEPHACVAVPGAMGRSLTIYTSTQGQFFVRDEVAQLVGLPTHAVTVETMAVGGAFGAKYGILEPLAAAVALALQQPVRIVMTRSEDMLATTPAPMTLTRIKIGAQQDGKLTALQAEILVDNGIFAWAHGWSMSNLIGGYYKCDNVQIDTYEVHTNKPQVGAYRAPGAPQATFALESVVEELARRLGIDPLEWRLQNGVETGDPAGNGRAWPSLGLKLCLQRLREHPLLQQSKAEDEGIGIAVGGWPTFNSPSEAVCRVDGSGTVIIESGHVDVSGNNSSFVLIAAELLGVTPDQVIVKSNSTQGAYAPNSGGSQVTYSVAGAIRQAAEEARQKLLQLAANEFEADAADLELRDGQAHVKGVPDKQISLARLAQIARSRRGGVGPIVGKGTSAIKENAPGFSVHCVKVKVDRQTGVVQPLQYVCVQDVGFAINPLLVEGQIHGGMAQGIGMGLYEKMEYDEAGQLLSGSLLDYGVPHSDQVPTLEAILLENRSPTGPFGARGVGEPPITGGAAAVANAIYDATGVRATELPLRQEQLLCLLRST